jgi:hypothetical protein
LKTLEFDGECPILLLRIYGNLYRKHEPKKTDWGFGSPSPFFFLIRFFFFYLLKKKLAFKERGISGYLASFRAHFHETKCCRINPAAGGRKMIF